MNDGAGYAALTPNALTRQFIIENDVPFAKQVVAHNKQCDKDALCQK